MHRNRGYDMDTLGRRVAGKRAEHRCTQQRLADQADVTQRTIAMVETGNRTGLSVGTLVAIADVLDVSLDYLVFGEASARRGKR